MERRGSTASRPYRQRARAEASARTRSAVLDAAVSAALETGVVNLSLGGVAERAGVSVQTVLRHFGSRDALFDAALQHGTEIVAAERAAPEGDVDAAVHALFDHYELRGDAVIRLLGQEELDERIARVTDAGRRFHGEWVTHLVRATSPLRERADVIDQLVVVTDVYVWKLLRRDRALERPIAEARVSAMIRAVLAAAAEEGSAS